MFYFCDYKKETIFATETQQMLKMELLTEKQKARRNRDYKVATEFKAMREKYPEAASSRIITNMAERHFAGLSSTYGIRTSLQRAGVKI